MIDNGQAGYSETGTWNTAVGGFNGTNRVAQTTHGSGATATATWSFSGVASGSYDVYVTFASKSTYSKAAPFSVADGGTGLGTQLINESILVTQAQGGRNEGSYGGVGWVELGTYSISSGTLNVVLGNNASGNFVDADGVLIVAHAHLVTLHSTQVSTDGAAGAPIGTVDLTPPVSGPSTKKGSSTGTTDRCDGCDQRCDADQSGDGGLQPGPGAKQPDHVAEHRRPGTKPERQRQRFHPERQGRRDHLTGPGPALSQEGHRLIILIGRENLGSVETHATRPIVTRWAGWFRLLDALWPHKLGASVTALRLRVPPPLLQARRASSDPAIRWIAGASDPTPGSVVGTPHATG